MPGPDVGSGSRVVYLLALAAGALFGIGSAVQQRAASKAPVRLVLHWRLLWYLVRQPLWLIGVGTALVGNVFAGIALASGGVALVQPLLVTRLMFALPFAAWWERRRLDRREWLGAAAVVLGLASFLAAARPSPSTKIDQSIWLWLAVLGGIGILTATLVALARRLLPQWEAPMLGGAAGILFGLQSALTRVAVRRLFDLGLLGMLLHWSPYTVAAVALTGTLLTQSAFRLAPLESSYPPLAAIEPLAGIAIGIGLLGDSVQGTPPVLAAGFAGVAVMTVGVWTLAVSSARSSTSQALRRASE
ncbi:DMT family transporter [Phytohabitans kaempferiae]|uniref:DMT family transporter n=1 Tax=Phytohabitans kaempferiae TaxID=1620943 RepID=A0ABV6M5H4_9ACTN